MFKLLKTIVVSSFFVALPALSQENLANCGDLPSGTYSVEVRNRSLKIACSKETAGGFIPYFDGSFTDYGDWVFVGTISNPSQIQLSNLSATAFKGVSLSGNCINQGYFTYEQKLLSARLGSFSLFSVTGIDLQYRLVYNPPGQSSIQICCNCPLDPIDDCPDLNITIRGTLLPARRGTARISGDWCKSLSCDGSYNKFLKTRDLE